MAEKWQDLDITKDELDRLGKALKNEEFRKLLVEYCDELNDPASRKQYEDEITELEKERGVEVTFIHPVPGYVIKTSVDGNKMAFVNVCFNENVDKPNVQSANQEGKKGQQWSLPHLLAPPREDMSKKGSRCKVFDVIFHPDTMQLASKSTQFRTMVNNVSCDAVESNFSVKLDKANMKFPKLQYKGMSKPIVIRKKKEKNEASSENTSENTSEKTESDEAIEKLYADMYSEMDKRYGQPNTNKQPKKVEISEKVSDYTVPKYKITHRSDIDLQDFTYGMDAKLNTTIPKELVVEINLPLLKSSADLVLDVTEKSISLISEKPAKYKLDITLPYPINEESGNAKFDIDHRKLIITLPVNGRNLLLSDIGRYDSGVDSDNSPLTDSPPSEKQRKLIEELEYDFEKEKDQGVGSQCSSVQSDSDVFRTSQNAQNVQNGQKPSFLNPDVHYSLPEYSCHLFDNILAFTLHVKNVDSNSIENEYNDTNSAIHVKFASISSGFFPVNYAFFVNFPSHFIDVEEVSIEAWDNNVTVQIPYQPCDKIITTYFAGISEETKEEKLLEEPSVINKKQLDDLNDSIDSDLKPSVKVQLNSEDELTIAINKQDGDDSIASTSKLNQNQELQLVSSAVSSSKNIYKSRSFSESSYDDLSPAKGKGILKLSRSYTPVSRSVSESSVDDYTWSSFENCAANSDTLIPEESESSSSMKKTVRFSDVVSKQLFRSNSSILGQRKKNQRKSRNKKRSQERKLSESETSEAEDRREKENSSEPEKDDNDNKKKNPDKKAENVDFKSDLIFDLDM